MLTKLNPGRAGIIRRCLIFCSVLAFSFADSAVTPARKQHVASRPWHVPRACLLTRNPVRATPLSLAAGRKIFLARCAGCHGSRGHGDGVDAPQLSVRPAVLSSARVREQTDSALWWKISLGKRPMPGYGLRLSSKDRWDVINYIRVLQARASSKSKHWSSNSESAGYAPDPTAE